MQLLRDAARRATERRGGDDELYDVVCRCARASTTTTLEELLAAHASFLGPRTTATVVNVLLDRAYQLERSDLAGSLLEAMRSWGVEADAETWEIRIAAMASDENWSQANAALKTMRRAGHALTAAGWTRLLRVCLAQGRPQMVRDEAVDGHTVFDPGAWATGLLSADMFPLPVEAIELAALMLSFSDRHERAERIVAHYLAEPRSEKAANEVR